MDELVKQLKATSLNANNSNELINILQKISASAETDPAQYEVVDITDGLLRTFTGSRDNRLREESAKTIAEITKTDGQRKRFTNPAVIHELLHLLDNLSDASLPMAIQSCRALGNICYQNDEARNLILESKGDATLIGLLNFAVSAANECHVNFSKLRGGLISNYLLGGEHLAKNAMELKIMDKIESIVDASCIDVEKNEDVLLHTLPLLSLLTENVSDLNFSSKLNAQLAGILAASKNPDVAEICLEMLHYQAENGKWTGSGCTLPSVFYAKTIYVFADAVKLELAKGGICETIYGLLETYKTLANTSEARALMKLACDLIVLILTGGRYSRGVAFAHATITTPLRISKIHVALFFLNFR